MRRAAFICLVLFLLPKPVYAETGVTLSSSAGNSFRSVILTVDNPGNKKYDRLFYLAVKQGMPALDEKDLTDGFLNGEVVSGCFDLNFRFTNAVFILKGNEKGLADGGRYDIYVKLTGSGGTEEFPPPVKDVMAQPFEKADGSRISIKTLRQLSNIQRLADLFVQTNGSQGSMDFLTSGDYSYQLTSDIKLTSAWKPIGNAGADERFVFRGNFDGGGHTIKNLRINRKHFAKSGDKVQGLFGKAENSKITDLNISNANVRVAGKNEADRLCVGTLAGESVDSSFENIRVNGATVIANGVHSPDGGTGGLVGLAVNTDFTSCGFTFGKVRGVRDAGGLVGMLTGDSEVNECVVSEMNIIADTNAGGLIGSAVGTVADKNAGHSLKIADSSADGFVRTDSGSCGGIAGSLSYAFLKNCSASGTVASTGSITAAGGFGGEVGNFSRVTDCMAYSDVTAANGYAGGFAGNVSGSSCVEFSQSSGNVKGGISAGGFVGKICADGFPNTLTNCMTLTEWVVGGSRDFTHRFVGLAEFNGVNNCYSYLGSMVTTDGELLPVNSGAYSVDGADFSKACLPRVIKNLSWDSHYSL